MEQNSCLDVRGPIATRALGPQPPLGAPAPVGLLYKTNRKQLIYY